MITLNLLPPEYRKKKGTFSLERLPGVDKISFQFVNKLPLKQIYLYGGGGLLAIYTLIFLSILFNDYTLKGLKKEWGDVAPEREKIDKLSKEYAELDATEKAREKLRGHFRWSQKLQELNDSVVRGVWLRELFLGERSLETPAATKPGSPSKKERTLILLGSAASPKGDETALVGRFIRSLKENKNFISDFSEVELESIKRREIQSYEVMDFKIICTFRDGVVE